MRRRPGGQQSDRDGPAGCPGSSPPAPASADGRLGDHDITHLVASRRYANQCEAIAESNQVFGF
ncbi:hypothetical protein [Actinokineospora inagensis]|uniref:hypothetical protein n=1 Tax=Actinokineospora inagensis TaxID=103730 RepID=UPI000423C09F|nr:hypothetical protein [Actinokineospora inagensis]